MGKRRKFPCSFGHCWGHGECQLSRRFQFKTFVLSLPPQPRRKQEEVGVKTAQISQAGEGGFLRLGKSSFPTRPGKWKSKGPSQTCLLAPNFVSTLYFFFFLRGHLCTQLVSLRPHKTQLCPWRQAPPCTCLLHFTGKRDSLTPSPGTQALEQPFLQPKPALEKIFLSDLIGSRILRLF